MLPEDTPAGRRARRRSCSLRGQLSEARLALCWSSSGAQDNRMRILQFRRPQPRLREESQDRASFHHDAEPGFRYLTARPLEHPLERPDPAAELVLRDYEDLEIGRAPLEELTAELLESKSDGRLVPHQLDDETIKGHTLGRRGVCESTRLIRFLAYPSRSA